MKPYRRSKLSLLVEETNTYTTDLERITMLRDKNFKMWTLEANRAEVEAYKQEWLQYNVVIDCMQLVLIQLSKSVLKERKASNGQD